MKSKFLLPALTAVLGFSAAWIAKPAATPVTVTAKSEDAPTKRTNRSEMSDRPLITDSKKPTEVKAGDFPLATQAEQGPKSRDEARMLRLTEALGLSIDQQSEIIKLIEDVQANADGKVSVIEDLATRGRIIEEGLAKLLSPEQLAKFQEIRARERDNLIELRSQKMLIGAIEDIDLSPEQREGALDRLRQKAKSELQAIPASATLLFDKSLLPTNKKELSVDGILMLTKMAEDPSNMTDPMAAHKQVIDSQRAELEDLLKCYDGILTPGQMGQYQAAIAETREIMKRLPSRAPDPTEKAEPPPAPVEQEVDDPPSPDDNDE